MARGASPCQRHHVGAAQSWTNNDDDTATRFNGRPGLFEQTDAGWRQLPLHWHQHRHWWYRPHRRQPHRQGGRFLRSQRQHPLFQGRQPRTTPSQRSNTAGTTLTGLLNAASSGGTITINRTDNAGTATTHTAGTLAIGGGNTLAVVAGSNINSGVNYRPDAGCHYLSGNAIFDVADNGVGIGNLTLGALNQSGGPFTITKQGAGNLTLGTAATVRSPVLPSTSPAAS